MCAAAAFGATLSQASAAIIDYYISGDGTDALWSGDFLITIAGDNSTVSGNEIKSRRERHHHDFLETELRPCLFRRDLELKLWRLCRLSRPGRRSPRSRPLRLLSVG